MFNWPNFPALLQVSLVRVSQSKSGIHAACLTCLSPPSQKNSTKSLKGNEISIFYIRPATCFTQQTTSINMYRHYKSNWPLVKSCMTKSMSQTYIPLNTINLLFCKPNSSFSHRNNNNNNNNNPICKAPECQKTSVALADRKNLVPLGDITTLSVFQW